MGIVRKKPEIGLKSCATEYDLPQRTIAVGLVCHWMHTYNKDKTPCTVDGLIVLH